MDQPNFLVIMTDQQRGDCLSADGHSVLMTPNMDAIGGAGVRFSRAYSTCPVCVPARRSFLSGQFPSVHGVLNNSNVQWEGPSLSSVLRDAGYQTEWIGRGMHQTPPLKRYGFEHMVFQDHRTEDDYDRFLAGREPEGSGGYYGTGVMHNDWTARYWHLDEAYHATNWTVSESLNFLKYRRDPSCPFFLVTSILAPHPPLVPPLFYLDRYLRQDLPRPLIGNWAEPPENDGVGDDVSAERVHLTGEALRSTYAGYYGLINHIDDQIRRLLNPVNGVQQMTGRNTVVIFFSDHGEMLGDHYRWRKSLPYEGSARIPFMINAPERFELQRGAVSDVPVCIEDLMPTILEMTDVAIPERVNGQSLLPLMRGAGRLHRPYLHIETSPTYHCLTDGKEKFIWFVSDGVEQFFDLVVDPGERHNLIEVSERQDRIGWWRKELVAVLQNRPEGFSAGGQLVAGRPYPGVMKKSPQ